MNCEAECQKYECTTCMEFRDQFSKALQKARANYEQQINNQKHVMKIIKRKIEEPVYKKYEKLKKMKTYASFMLTK